MSLNRRVDPRFVNGLGQSRTSVVRTAGSPVTGRTATKKGQSKLVNVSYPDHHRVFKERIWQMFINKIKVDLEIGSVGVHQLILALFIPQLAQLLDAATNCDENSCGLDLGLIDSDAEDDFMLLIEFVYRGTLVGVNRRQLKSLRQLTNKLKVPLVVEDDTGRGTDAIRTTAIRCRPALPKKKVPEEPAATSREWLDVEDVLNNVPAGVTVLLRGNREFRRDRRSNRRRDQSARLIESGSSEPTGTAEAEASVTAGDDSYEIAVNPDDVLAANTAVTSAELTSMIYSNDSPNVDSAVISGSTTTKDSEPPVMVTARMPRPVKAGALQKCPKCPYQTHYRHRYASHIRNKHDPSRVLLKCNSCDRFFYTKEGIERHLLTHKDDQQTYECKHCDYATPKKLNFQRHMTSKHNRTVDDEPIPARYHCKVCSYGCTHQSQLISHMFREHSATTPPFKCPHCSYCSITYCNIERHVNSVHLNYRPMMCHTCGRRFRNRCTLKAHVRIHTKERPYRCRVSGCDKAFTDLTGLKRHHLSHGNHKPFVCDQCGYACKVRYNLRAHLKRHKKVTDGAAP